ncbi:enoyl-CoA hydratase/isomerase family protein [Xanthomonas albilineans]|uniref:enoyl-CoA hydratase/isomerase family protein n=1 Tax=Xanthomonas albilineans TaxID=29447 RepID=UPI0005F35128|nr:enoyl-CoA hydratase/isomerase family protein [Xanthomonas albilineans]
MNAPIQMLDHGPIRELRLARAPVNALDTALCTELAAAIAQAQADAMQALVLSGSERVFSAGMDVPHLLGHGDDRAKLRDSWQHFFAAARALADSTIPVAAALTGHAPAGGCVLALCCDYRVMARSSDPAHPVSIGLNETEVGLVAPEGIQRLLRRVIGAHRAERLLVAGELVSAERALEIGLIDELADAERVVARAVAWLQELLRRPRQPMLQTRAIARVDLRAALSEEHIALERLLDNWHTPDTQTALHALVKRLSKR